MSRMEEEDLDMKEKGGGGMERTRRRSREG